MVDIEWDLNPVTIHNIPTIHVMDAQWILLTNRGIQIDTKSDNEVGK